MTKQCDAGGSRSDPIYVTRSFLPPLEEYVAELRTIWDTHVLTNNGPAHNALMSALKEYLSVRGLSLFVNGHLSLEAAIKALRLEGEIITTPFTFASTTHAIANTGCSPVFCDIKESDYTIDESRIEALIGPRTSAILPVHVFGYPCDLGAIEDIARRRGLRVIYDAAHAFGVRVGGRGIASFGDISMFSFHATKVFHTIEGGALAYGDEALAAELNLIKNFGISGPDRIERVGFNAKMNEFQAAMGLVCLRHIGSEIEKRKGRVALYRELLAGIEGLRFSEDAAGMEHNYAYFPVLIDPRAFGCTRDDVFEALAGRGINARKYFFPLTSECPSYASARGASSTPVARYCADNILTLPLWSEIPDEAIARVCETISSLRRRA